MSKWTILPSDDFISLDDDAGADEHLPECRYQPNFCPTDVILLIPNAEKNISLPGDVSEAMTVAITCGTGRILMDSDGIYKVDGTGHRTAELVCSEEDNEDGRAWKFAGTDKIFHGGDLECHIGRRTHF